MWVQTKAHSERESGRVGTHVCLAHNGDVLAFYAVKHIIVSLTGASRKMRDTAEADGVTTGLLLAQMGIREDHQGSGAGKLLMRHVLREAARLHADAPFKLLVVDAADVSLTSFYEGFGFAPLKGSYRMAIKMSAVRRAVGA